MKRKSSKKKLEFNSEDEAALCSIYKKEFNDCFPLILTLPAGEFLSQLTKKVEYETSKQFNDFSQSIKAKVEDYIISTVFPSEYKIAFTAMKAIKKKLEANASYPPFKGDFTPHCQLNPKPIHSCGNSLYLFTYSKTAEGCSSKESYLLCPKCDEVYKGDFVKLFCEECKVDYYTTINSESQTERKLQVATWEKYHCNVIINDCMKCFKCKSPFYLDTTGTTQLLTCSKCDNAIEQENVVWKCVRCKEEFHSKAKAYNPLEFKNTKLSIKEAMINKDKAKPQKVPCCNIDISQVKFYHNSKCKGELVLGALNREKIVVCSKCETFKRYEGYPWCCPNCEERFIIDSVKGVPIAKSFFLGSDVKERSQHKAPSRYGSNIRLNTDLRSSNCASPQVATPFELVRERRRTSLKKTNEDLLRSSLIRPPRDSEGNNKPLHKTSIKNKEAILCRSPLLPVKINLANKFLKMKMLNFEEDIPGPIAEDIVRENELTKKIIKDISNSNLFSTASSNEASEQSNPNTLKATSIEEAKEKEKKAEDKPQYPLFNIDEFKIVKQIGVGAFGKIYLVESPKKEKFAMKKIVGTSMEELSSLKTEYEILLSLHNKNKNLNLVKIQGIQSKQLDQTTFVMYVLMELAERDWEKELAIRSKAKTFYKEKELVEILSSLIKTFAHLQRHNISHRDIKPQNILLFSNSEFKLADFGEAKILRSDLPDTNKQTLRGTELYMSPILFKALRNRVVDLKYVDHNTYKSDVFSFGLCALYAATLTFQSLYEIREVYEMDRIKASLSKYLSLRYSQRLIELISKMLDVNEKARCDFLELEKAFDDYCN